MYKKKNIYKLIHKHDTNIHAYVPIQIYKASEIICLTRKGLI